MTAVAEAPAEVQKLTVHLRVKRYNPETDKRPHWQEFEVEAEPTDRVLDALHTAKWTVDGTLTFRRSCAHGVCGSDAMVINGANRLGTNSLLDIVVFGKRGGAAMARFVETAEMPPLEAVKGAEEVVRDHIGRLLAATGGEKVAEIRTRLQDEMMAKAGVFRTGESLGVCLQTIRELRQAYEKISIDDHGSVFNYDLAEALELGYLLDLAEATVISGEARTESRGAHWRDDFPTRDDVNWMKHTLAHLAEDGTVTLSYKPVIGGAYQPMERKY